MPELALGDFLNVVDIGKPDGEFIQPDSRYAKGTTPLEKFLAVCPTPLENCAPEILLLGISVGYGSE